MVFFARKKVDISTPIRQAPTQALSAIQKAITNQSLLPDTRVNLGTYATTDLPPNLSFLRDVEVIVPQSGKLTDANLQYKGKDTGIRVDEVNTLLYGDSFSLTKPQIREFYKRLGASSDLLDSSDFKALEVQIDKRFPQSKAYAQAVRERVSKQLGVEWSRRYGDTPESFEIWAKENPEQFNGFMDKLMDDPVARNKILITEKLKSTWESVKNQVTLRRAFYLSIIGGVIAYVEGRRTELNGCVVFDQTEGWGGKVELLTCSDKHVEKARSSNDAPLILTCATQNYPTETAVECPVVQFNPCLASGSSRSNLPNYPLVPDVCTQYLYRKTLGPKDTSTAVSRSDSCSQTINDGLCSSYCDAERFSNMFGDDSADKSLKCRNLSYGEALIYTMIDALGDTLCQLIPWTCSKSASPGWEWWKILLVVLGGIALVALMVFMYRKFFAKKTSQADKKNLQ